MHRILAVEDDPSITHLYETLLAPKSQLLILPTGTDFLSKVEGFLPHLIILDVELGSHEDGFGLASQLQTKPETRHIPILFVTAKDSPEAMTKGFRLGADDYLVKPFHPYELVARCEHRIRKASDSVSRVRTWTKGPLRLDLMARRCFVDEREVELSPAEFQILLSFINNENRVIQRKELAKEALGDRNIKSRLIDSYVSSLRRKIPWLRDAIESIYGVGYKLKSFKDGTEEGSYVG